MDTSITDQLLATTRSVRKRLDLERPVDREVVLDCLRLAVQAPSGGNTQGWRWLVVTEQRKRARLAEIYRECGYDYLKRTADTSADLKTRRVYESAVYLADHLHEVPIHVIPCLVGRVDGKSNPEAAGFYGSIIPAAWSFMLALRSHGLGSAWTTIHLAREQEAAQLLGIPENVSQIALLPVAYTIGTDFKPGSRTPVEGVTFWDTWDTSSA